MPALVAGLEHLDPSVRAGCAQSLGVMGFGARRALDQMERCDIEYLRRIALVMGQKSMLWWDVPAMDSLLLHKDMYALPDAEFREDPGLEERFHQRQYAFVLDP